MTTEPTAPLNATERTIASNVQLKADELIGYVDELPGVAELAAMREAVVALRDLAARLAQTPAADA